MKAIALRSVILDYVLGGVAPAAAPGTVYVALYTTAPTEYGGGVECSGNGYSRVAVTNSLVSWPAAVSGAKSNGSDIVFPAASGSWGTVVAFGIHSHASNDALLVWGALDASVVPEVSDTPTFAAGSLQFSEA